MAQRDRRLLKWASLSIKPYITMVLGSFFLGLLSMGLGMVQPILFSRFIDKGLVQGSLGSTIRYLSLMVGCSTEALAINHTRARISVGARTCMARDFQCKLLRTLIESDEVFIRVLDPGDEAQVILGDAQATAQALWSLPEIVAYPILTTIGYGVALWQIAPPSLFILLLLMTPLHAIWQRYRVPVYRNKQQELRSQNGFINGHVNFVLARVKQIALSRASTSIPRQLSSQTHGFQPPEQERGTV